jgi:hypothetical protein
MVSGIYSWRIGCAAILLALAVTSCSRAPSDAAVRADFLREHPDVSVESVGVGESDGSAAYFHIRYKRPGDDTVYEDVWQYLDAGEKQWRLNHKETLGKARRQ